MYIKYLKMIENKQMSIKRSGRRSSGRVKLQDIALECDLSVSTVSRILNNHTDKFPLANHTIDKVHAVAKKLGYRPNRLARAIAYGKTNLVGLSIPHHQGGAESEKLKEDTYFTAQIFGLLAGGILDNSSILSYDLVIHDRRKFNHTKHSYDAFQSDLLDGIIYCNPTTDSINFISSLRSDFPVVLLGYSPELSNRVISVDIDNIKAAHNCIQHLKEIGRKNTLILNPSNLNHYLCIKDRLSGYFQGLDYLGQKKRDCENLIHVNQDASSVKNWISSNRKLLDQFDSIVAPTDEMAIFCINALVENGYRIPQDIAVIGFSDSIQAQLNSPPLTSVKMPFHEMGYRAAGFLADVLNQKKPFVPQHYTLETTLVIRESTSMLPNV